jgi:hypothetical protein
MSLRRAAKRSGATGWTWARGFGGWFGGFRLVRDRSSDVLSQGLHRKIA